MHPPHRATVALPRDEEARVRALHELDVLDGSASASLDRITRVTARLLDAPISVVSLIDRDRHVHKSAVGLPRGEMSREHSFCLHAIESTAVMVVPDTSRDERFSASPLVLDDPSIRFYAGAPLVTADGYGIGALCVMDTVPRALDDAAVGLLQDLAGIVMTQLELRRAIGHLDPVTGLPNRARYLQDLDDLPAGEWYVSLVVDVAEPARLNDVVRTFGVRYAEDSLKACAVELRKAIAPPNVLYHVNTTQFATIVPERSAAAEQIFLDFFAAQAPDGGRLAPTAYGGLSRFRAGEMSASDVLRIALSAAHDALETRCRYSAYDRGKDEAHRRAAILVTDLRRALEDGTGLRLVYQPRVDAHTEECNGAEALLRWRHPALGDVSPAEFIPLSDRAGLSRQVTDWVLEHVLAQIASWCDRGIEPCISLNISRSNLEEDDFAARLLAKLSGRGLPPDRIELELSENRLIAPGDQSVRQLARLRDRGIGIAIDDFGTGYSNLSYFTGVPAGTIKLDQSFIRTIVADRANQIIVRSTVALAHELGYHVVAEGVETAEILAAVRACGCDEIQGFHIARPLDPDVFEAWFEERRSAAGRP